MGLGEGRDSLGAILTGERTERPRRIAQLLGQPYVDAWEGTREGWAGFTAARNSAAPVDGYSLLFQRVVLDRREKAASLTLQAMGNRYAARLDSTEMVFVRLGADSAAVHFPLIPLLDRLAPLGPRDGLPPEAMMLEGSAGALRVRVLFEHILVRAAGDRRILERVSGVILLAGEPAGGE